jgi:exo-1,4-beta-D-glucosaminidase
VLIKQSTGGELVLPILWSDNDVTLWPGESVTLTARFAIMGAETPAPTGGPLAGPSVLVEARGWNVPTQSVPVAVESH